jgi:hypothetical protein
VSLSVALGADCVRLTIQAAHFAGQADLFLFVVPLHADANSLLFGPVRLSVAPFAGLGIRAAETVQGTVFADVVEPEVPLHAGARAFLPVGPMMLLVAEIARPLFRAEVAAGNVV